MPTARRILTALATVAAVSATAAALVACGSDNNGGTSSTSSTGGPAASTAVPPPAAAGTEATPITGTGKQKPSKGNGPPASVVAVPGQKNVVVPDLVGKTLADAQTALRSAGLVLDAESTKGDRSQIQTDWEVCQTVPGAGKRTPAGSPIAVITAAPGGC